MGNGASRNFNEKDVPKKVAKWRAELEHVKELNKMLTEERRIMTTSMEQELYDKQVELFYLGKSATKHIGFRGYLKIINKVSPRTQADFMTPGDYDRNKKPATQSTAMVLRSAILNFSLFALFEAWLLKRMHFVSIQKHQRRLHQKGWKNIVAFYSEEIPSIQEIFDKQEPHLQERVEIGKKENMELLEKYETLLFQQEEEIMRLRKQLEEIQGLSSGFGAEGGEMMMGEDQQTGKSRMSLETAFLGTTEAHREFNKARSPVQALIQNMQKVESKRVLDDGPIEKGWRTEPSRTWGAASSDDDSDNESLYTEKSKNSDAMIGAEKHGWRSAAKEDSYENDHVLKNKVRAFEQKMTSKGIAPPNHTGVPSDDDGVSAITDEYSDNTSGSGAAKQQQQQLRNKDAIRLERERLEKAKAERKRRKETERKERESFYKQERERLQHQEKRLNLKREESVRKNQGRFDDDASQDGFMGAVEEMEGSEKGPYDPSSPDNDIDEDQQDILRERAPKRRGRKMKGSASTLVDEKDDEHTEEYDDEELDGDEEVIGLNDMDLGDGPKKRDNAMFNPQQHPSMDTDALIIDSSTRREKMERRKMWNKDRADSDKDLGGDDDSIGNEIKRLEELEMETSVHRSVASGGDDLEELEVRSATRSRGAFGGSTRSKTNNGMEDTVPLDGASRSKPVRSSVSKLSYRFEVNSNDSGDAGSVYSKTSKGSTSTGRKKKKKGKLVNEQGEVVVRKKKKKKKRPKQNEDDETYYEDEDMTVTSALTSNSYD